MLPYLMVHTKIEGWKASHPLTASSTSTRGKSSGARPTSPRRSRSRYRQARAQSCRVSWVLTPLKPWCSSTKLCRADSSRFWNRSLRPPQEVQVRRLPDWRGADLLGTPAHHRLRYRNQRRKVLHKPSARHGRLLRESRRGYGYLSTRRVLSAQSLAAGSVHPGQEARRPVRRDHQQERNRTPPKNVPEADCKEEHEEGEIRKARALNRPAARRPRLGRRAAAGCAGFRCRRPSRSCSVRTWLPRRS